MENQNPICEERHKNVDSRLDGHDKTLSTHEGRLEKLENTSIRSEVMIQNLCEQIKSLVGIVKAVLFGGAAFAISIGIGFIIWYIQNHVG